MTTYIIPNKNTQRPKAQHTQAYNSESSAFMFFSSKRKNTLSAEVWKIHWRVCTTSNHTTLSICSIYFSRLTVTTFYDDFPLFNLIFFHPCDQIIGGFYVHAIQFELKSTVWIIFKTPILCAFFRTQTHHVEKAEKWIIKLILILVESSSHPKKKHSDHKNARKWSTV